MLEKSRVLKELTAVAVSAAVMNMMQSVPRGAAPQFQPIRELKQLRFLKMLDLTSLSHK